MRRAKQSIFWSLALAGVFACGSAAHAAPAASSSQAQVTIDTSRLLPGSKGDQKSMAKIKGVTPSSKTNWSKIKDLFM